MNLATKSDRSSVVVAGEFWQSGSDGPENQPRHVRFNNPSSTPIPKNTRFRPETPYSVSVSSLVAGSYTFSAVATDNLGAKATNTISLTVNALPTVSITSPTNGASFIAPANITIDASASDPDGAISKVEFFQGTNKLGEDLTNPYSLIWSNVAVGNYSLTVRATDNLGAAIISAAISISVTNSAANPVTILNPAMVGSDFVFSFSSQSGTSYDVQYKDASEGSSWQSLTNLTGNGSILNVTNQNPSSATRLYRVSTQSP